MPNWLKFVIVFAAAFVLMLAFRALAFSVYTVEGKGLQPAQGGCPNELFTPAQIKEPLLSQSLTSKPQLTVKKVYEYDIQTVPGQICEVRCKR